MINLWYARITILRVSKLSDVPERYYDAVAAKLAENSYDENGDKNVPVAE